MSTIATDPIGPVSVIDAQPVSSDASRLLAMQPPFISADPWNRAVQRAIAGELLRIEVSMQMVRDALIPSQADDVILPTGQVVPCAEMLEALLGISIAPAGFTIEQRRSRIVAHIRKLNSGTGADWVANLTEILGTGWTYEEGPGAYQVTIHIAFASGTLSADEVVAFARAITPAHLDVIPAFNEGFLVGISSVGVEPI